MEIRVTKTIWMTFKYASMTEAGEGMSAILTDVGTRKGKKFKDFEAEYGFEILGLEHYKELL